MTAVAPRIEPLADDAWLVTLGAGADPATNRRVHGLTARIGAAAPEWLVDLVPAHSSLAVFFDPAHGSAAGVRAWLLAMAAEPHALPTGEVRVVEVPVAYGGDFGPDLEPAAARLGLDPDELAAAHAGAEYTVAMVGFAPGFPYLSGLDPCLALERHSTPRTRVPAGSVGIGGAQTGIYPREGPGGWQLLGRTPLRLFDPGADPPALLQPGDTVRFRRIDATEFARLEARQ